MGLIARSVSLALSAALFMGAGAFTPTAGATPLLPSGTATLAPMVDEVAPGVVGVSVSQAGGGTSNPLLEMPMFKDLFEQMERKRGGTPRQRAGNLPEVRPAGSGVVVDAAEGIVLTNNHVIQGASRIVVVLKDRREFEAQLLGTDPGTDIAVLKIKPDRLTAVKLGDSESLKVGDFAVAIGNPFSLGQTVTMGIVSAVGRGLSANGFEDYVQTDAAINPGNSGGALVNLKGELIGINTAIYSRGGPGAGNIGIGFAVPTHMAKEVMGQIRRFGAVRRGRIGAQLDEVTPEVAAAQSLDAIAGAVATEVSPGSAAARGGLQVGDVVLRVNGRPVRTSADVRNRVAVTPVGDPIELQVSRNRQLTTLRLQVEAMPTATATGPGPSGPAQPGQSSPQGVPGQGSGQSEGQGSGLAALQAMTLGAVAEGVRVMQVVPRGAAQIAGFRQGDVILAVERDVVRNPQDVGNLLAKSGRKTLTILRGDTKLRLTVN